MKYLMDPLNNEEVKIHECVSEDFEYTRQIYHSKVGPSLDSSKLTPTEFKNAMTRHHKSETEKAEELKA